MSETVTKSSDYAAPDIVKMSGVRFAWPGGRAFEISVNELSLAASSRTLLVGPSGGGKSTLLSLLCGIVTPQQGEISVLGTDIVSLSSTARDKFRAEHIGVIFLMFNLLPYGSVIDNVVLPLSFASGRRQRVAKTGDAAAEAERILLELGLDRSALSGSASALSVGQQQRVAVARALIGTPELLVADEPTSALDEEHQERFLDLLFRQIEGAGSSLLMVSHDRRISPMFDTVIELGDVVTVRGEA